MTADLRSIAWAHGLPWELVNAIIQVESHGDPDAVKYEPAFVQAYLAGRRWPVFAPWITQDTEIWQRGASWGLMQVMGQVARERGFTGIYISDLCHAEVGVEYGCRYLVHQFRRFHKLPTGIRGVVSSYNAGSPASHNQEYVNKVEANIPGGFASLEIDVGGMI